MSDLFKSSRKCYLIDHHSPQPPVIPLNHLDIQEYENTNSRLIENMSTDVKKEITSVASGELKFPGGGKTAKYMRIYDV